MSKPSSARAPRTFSFSLPAAHRTGATPARPACGNSLSLRRGAISLGSCSCRCSRRARPGKCPARMRAEIEAMYVSMLRLRVAPQKADELISAFRARAHLVESADGYVDLQVWQSDRDPTEVLMLSR